MSNDLAPTRAGFVVLILCSPSGAGKTTLKNRLLTSMPELRFSVSHTTRRPRSHEQDGREYHFVSRERFEAMIVAGAFAEWAEVHGNLYGTSMGEIVRRDERHDGVVLDIDVQGARQIVARVPQAVTVFVLPPSFEELERRLRGRGDEPEESVRVRLRNARDEVAHYGAFDFVIVNDDLERASTELSSVVIAARCRRAQVAARAERLLDAGRHLK